MSQDFLHGVEIIEVGSTSAPASAPAPPTEPAASGDFDFSKPLNTAYAALIQGHLQ